MLLAIVVIRNLEMYQVDFKSAFLNGDINKIIFMEQPDGQVHQRKGGICLQVVEVSIWAKAKLKSLVPKAR